MESVSAMNVSVETFSPIPEELVYEIFSRLPSKAIARFRCVSKLWFSMLGSQYFTECFLTKSCARPQLLFACEDHTVDNYTFFSSPQPENPEENSYVVAPNQLARFPCSYGSSAPTRGFFCNVAEQTFTFEGKKLPEVVPVICNPSTGQTLTLPRLKQAIPQGVDTYLGYDPASKEFKVLSMALSYVSDAWFSVRHQVLTLGTKILSWRLVECSIPHLSSRKWICISGVLFYTAKVYMSSLKSVVICFDLRSEKFSSVNFSRAMLMFGDYSISLELWVLRDAEWSKHVYVVPPSWKDVVTETMRIAGMVGTNEIVLSPRDQNVPSYVIYYTVESKTIRKVGIQGVEAFQGKRLHIYLNYVENVKLL